MSGDPDSAATPAPAETAAARVLDKLRSFISTLDDDERAVMAALLARGVASAYEPEDEAAEPDVVGFSMDMRPWQPERLPDSLATQVREQRLRVEFD